MKQRSNSQAARRRVFISLAHGALDGPGASVSAIHAEVVAEPPWSNWENDLALNDMIASRLDGFVL